jgi:hypothetical protein
MVDWRKGTREGLLMHFGYVTVVTFEGVEVNFWESGLQVRQAGVTQGVV